VPVLAEVFRAVRPGGHVALQEWTSSAPGGADPPAEKYAAALAAAGFVDARVVPADLPAEDEPTIVAIVRARVRELLGEAVEIPAFGVERAEGRSLVQIFARRPS